MSQTTPVIARKQPRQARAKATVDTILEAATRVLVEQGYDKASTNRIAEVAGVSVGSLYQYFPNKEAIVFTLAQRHSEEMIGLLADLANGITELPLPEAVRRFVRVMLKAHSANPDLHRALVHQVLHVGFEQMSSLQAQATGLVRGYLEWYRDDLLPKNLDIASYVLVTTVEGLTHGAVLENPALLDDPAFEEEVVALVVRYLIGS